MKKKYGLVVALLAALCALSGCGKDEKLKLVTTESAVGKTTPVDAEQQGEKDENSQADTSDREEASQEDKQITLEQIDAANRGDRLLASGSSYRLDTVYYEDGQEYTEAQFLGFTDEGTYLQVSQDVDGVFSILDKNNGYWYVIDDSDIKVQIYPETGVADAIINVNHNDFIVSLSDSNQSITDIYREKGKLVVETAFHSDEGAFTFVYVLNDDLRVIEYRCLDNQGKLLSKSDVTEDASVHMPEEVLEDEKLEEYRTVEFRYPGEEGLSSTYYVPKRRDLKLETLEYFAYADEACTIFWDGSPSDEEDGFEDEIIYLAK